MNLYLEPKTSKDRPYSKPSVFTEEGKSILWGSYPFLGIAIKASPPAESHPFLNCCALYNLGRSEIVRLERLVFCSMCF